MSPCRWPRRLRAAVLLASGFFGGLAPAMTSAAEPCPRVEIGVFHQQPSGGTRSVRGPEGQAIHFERTPITRLGDVARVQLGSDRATVLLNVKADAAERLKVATTGRSGIRLAVVVDDQAVLAVVWEGDYGFDSDGLQLSLRSEDSARELVATVSRCIGEAGTPSGESGAKEAMEVSLGETIYLQVMSTTPTGMPVAAIRVANPNRDHSVITVAFEAGADGAKHLLKVRNGYDRLIYFATGCAGPAGTGQPGRLLIGAPPEGEAKLELPSSTAKISLCDFTFPFPTIR